MDKSQTEVNETTSRPATYQDVIDAPPHLVAEIVDSVLYTRSRHTFEYGYAAGALLIKLGSHFGQGSGDPRGWWIFPEPEVHLGDDVLVPDLAGWRQECMPRIPDGVHTDLAPDWVCEILSPSARKLDCDARRAVYARASVGYMWQIDADNRSLEAFRLLGGDWGLLESLSGNVPVSLSPFEEVRLDLRDLWTPYAFYQERRTQH